MLVPALSALSASVSMFASVSASAFAYCKSQSSVFTSSKELINLALCLSWLHHLLETPLYHPNIWPWQHL